jgi:hypothetical protein
MAHELVFDTYYKWNASLIIKVKFSTLNSRFKDEKCHLWQMFL